MIETSAVKYYVANCEERLIHSSAGNLPYRILISRPKEAPTEGGYPVIYALDGDAVFNTLAETARLQTRKPHGFDPAVVVAIGYPSREPFDMTRRCYDMTIPAQKGSLRARPNGEEWPEHGGADQFLDFIEHDLKPLIAAELPVDQTRQTIFGHSLGGLFVLHALFSRPQTFQNYVAGSPSIWWGSHEVLKQKGPFADKLREREGACQPRLLVTIGGEELNDMVKDAEQLVCDLQPSVAGFDVSLAKFSEEGHVSVLPAAISRLVKFALEKKPQK
ncbi:Ferri-bacillibactin esterase BesA [compost metagenome]